MSKSRLEEIIAILWFILSLMLIDRGYLVFGKIACGLGVLATVCSFVFGVQAAKDYAQKRKLRRREIWGLGRKVL